jgi:hypothetical protein
LLAALIVAVAVAAAANSAPSAAEHAAGAASAWAQTGQLTVAGVMDRDELGSSVAASGTVVAVGAPYARVGRRAAGRVYMFQKRTGRWRETASLAAADSASYSANAFGYAVAVSGSTVVVGAPLEAGASGRVYVFQQHGRTWRQTAELKGSGRTHAFGDFVGVSNGTVVVSSEGPAYVFGNGGEGWRQQAKLLAHRGAGAVGISGGTVVVASSGRGYVFQHGGQAWRQTAELTVPRSNVSGSDDLVAVSGDTALLGGTGPGYVFQREAAGWRQTAELGGTASALPSTSGGEALALSGTTAVLGVSSVIDPSAAGHAYVFLRRGEGWSRTAALTGSGTYAATFGAAVAVSGSTVFASAIPHGALVFGDGAR